MATSQPGLWTVLPNSLRSALIIALSTSFIAGGALFRAESSSELSSGITGGNGAVRLGSDGYPTETATPGPTAPGGRSQAVLTAPDEEEEIDVDVAPGSQMPAFGRYVYTVDGYEQSAAFGQRALPPEAMMTVDRKAPPDSTVPGLAKNELLFDLAMAEDYREQSVVAYGKNGMSYTYESRANTIDPIAPASEASYEPPVLQIPAKLESGTKVEGSSTGTDPQGAQTSLESWTVEVTGTESMTVLGKKARASVVTVTREPEPGSGEQVRRTRRYWFVPERAIWVKWEETTTGTEPFGPGNINYTVKYTATLDRIEPL